MVKMIVTDLDGTLLNDKKQISSADCLSLSNKFVVLATGRHYTEIITYINDLSPKNCYSITSDGCYIFDKRGSVIFKKQLLRREDIKIIRDISKCKSMLIVTNSSNFYIPFSLKNKILSLFKRNKRINDEIEIEKIRIPISRHNENVVSRLKERYSLHVVFGKYIDIKTKGVNKFEAIKYICKKHNVSLNEVVFFGDDLNDYECFKNIPISIAMANADPLIKKEAAFITKSNNESGVSFALENFL